MERQFLFCAWKYDGPLGPYRVEAAVVNVAVLRGGRGSKAAKQPAAASK